MSIKTKILMLKGESGGSSDVTWGSITGTLSDQTDLKTELDSKVDASSIFDLIYPVGCYYWSSNSTNPSTLFGGTWEQIKDRFILSAGTTYSEGTTGGEAKHYLTLSEMPSHRHTTGPNSVTAYGGLSGDTIQTGSGYSVTLDKVSTGYTGGGSSHNNMPPYLVAYCWHRTA